MIKYATKNILWKNYTVFNFLQIKVNSDWELYQFVPVHPNYYTDTAYRQPVSPTGNRYSLQATGIRVV